LHHLSFETLRRHVPVRDGGVAYAAAAESSLTEATKEILMPIEFIWIAAVVAVGSCIVLSAIYSEATAQCRRMLAKAAPIGSSTTICPVYSHPISSDLDRS
jgi:hypothetical protein